MLAWMRVLTVELVSKISNRKFVFGENWKENKDDLDITVTVHKYASVLNNACTITISNLTYKEVIEIIQGKFYEVNVICGYRTTSRMTVFNGEVLNISNFTSNHATHTVSILCTSKFVASYGQQRMNLGIKSGVNTYSALKYICRQAGIPNSNISNNFKRSYTDQVISETRKGVGSYFGSLSSDNPSIILNSDSSEGDIVTIFDGQLGNGRVINLTSANTILQSYPKLTNEGLTLKCFPILNFMCGDTIKLDNSIINIYVTADGDASTLSEAASRNYGYYLDSDGAYIVMEITYELSNRSDEFSCELSCKPRSVVRNIVGG